MIRRRCWRTSAETWEETGMLNIWACRPHARPASSSSLPAASVPYVLSVAQQKRTDAFGTALLDWVKGGTVPETIQRDDGYVEENLWTGIGRARSGCGAAIVGDPDQVRAKLAAYRALGIDTFILSGYPHLQEAERFGRLVLGAAPQGGI